MGPYAIRDIRNAVAAGRHRVEDPELAWRQATHAIAGFSLAVYDKNVLPGKMDEAVVNLHGRRQSRRSMGDCAPSLPRLAGRIGATVRVNCAAASLSFVSASNRTAIEDPQSLMDCQASVL